MRALTMLVLLALSSVALADAISVPECVEVSKESSYRGLGYAHVLTVKNGCDTPIRCSASSDSAPSAVSFVVAAGAEHSQTLKVGAPGSDYDLRLTCQHVR